MGPNCLFWATFWDWPTNYYPRGVIGSTVGAYPGGAGSNPFEGEWALFFLIPSALSVVFSDTLPPTQRRSLQMLDVAVPQIGVGVFHAWLFRGGAGGWVSGVFVSTDARRAYFRGVIGSTVGEYPRGAGSNPVEGNGHFFFLIPPALSFVFLWHIHTYTHTHARTHTGTHTLSDPRTQVHKDTHVCTSTYTHTSTHTHTHVYADLPFV